VAEVAGGAAHLVDPRDEDALAGGLERLLDDQDFRATLVARGRRRVGEFSWARTARGLNDVYARLAG
jgi:glycosyltransferase involved in cell wall biosynthesis